MDIVLIIEFILYMAECIACMQCILEWLLLTLQSMWWYKLYCIRHSKAFQCMIYRAQATSWCVTFSISSRVGLVINWWKDEAVPTWLIEYSGVTSQINTQFNLSLQISLLFIFYLVTDSHWLSGISLSDLSTACSYYWQISLAGHPLHRLIK